jgi:hypothetical protein
MISDTAAARAHVLLGSTTVADIVWAHGLSDLTSYHLCPDCRLALAATIVR